MFPIYYFITNSIVLLITLIFHRKFNTKNLFLKPDSNLSSFFGKRGPSVRIFSNKIVCHLPKPAFLEKPVILTTHAMKASASSSAP